MTRKRSSRKGAVNNPGRWLRFEEADRELIKEEVRSWFRSWRRREVLRLVRVTDFTSVDSQTKIRIIPKPPYDIKRVERYLQYLSVPESVRNEMIEFYTGQNQKYQSGIIDWFQNMNKNTMRTWFAYLSSFTSTRLHKVLRAKSGTRRRWKSRFQKHGVGWGDVRLTSDTVASITADLLDELDGEKFIDRETIKKMHQRWNKSQMK